MLGLWRGMCCSPVEQDEQSGFAGRAESLDRHTPWPEHRCPSTWGGAFEGMGKGSQRMLYREPEGLPVPFIRGPVSPLFLAITILHQNQLFPYLSI